jgi:hypothetical protein
VEDPPHTFRTNEPLGSGYDAKNASPSPAGSALREDDFTAGDVRGTSNENKADVAIGQMDGDGRRTTKFSPTAESAPDVGQIDRNEVLHERLVPSRHAEAPTLTIAW